MRPLRPRKTTGSAEQGTTILEALIASAIVVCTIAGVAQLLVWSRRTAWSTGAVSTATVLAQQKLEQLHSLVWHVDTTGAPISDFSTDVSAEPSTIAGQGLVLSPPGTLDASIDPWVDYLDVRGRWIGAGSHPPAGSAFVRRWAVRPFGADPLHTRVLHVVVLPLADVAAGASGRRPVGGVHLSTVRTRVVP